MVNEILGDLFKAAQAELLSAAPGGLTAVAPHAKMVALRDLQMGLQSVVDDYKIHTRTKGTQE